MLGDSRLATISILFGCTIVGTLPCAVELRAADQDAKKAVNVRLSDGRHYRGHIDGKSDRDRLVLRSSHGTVTLWRRLPWAQIARIESDGDALDIATLKGNERPIRSTNNSVANIRINTLAVSLQSKLDAAAGALVAGPPRVTGVAFDAGIANWDGDVESDGLVVEIATLDADGALAIIEGTVEVELFMPQRRTLDLAPLSGGDTLEAVERWTRAIRPADFGPGGVRLKLPFGAINPELRPEWTASHYGLVHVRLAAPGHGVFEASRDGVRAQPWAPNRDRMEMQNGGRFLPTERVGNPQ